MYFQLEFEKRRKVAHSMCRIPNLSDIAETGPGYERLQRRPVGIIQTSPTQTR